MSKSALFKASAAVAGAYTALSGLVFYEVMGRNAKLPPLITELSNKKSESSDPSRNDNEDERVKWFKSQQLGEYYLESDTGKKLKGFLLEADEPSDVYVFCSHGYRCNGRRECRYYAQHYHELGFNVFIVDHQAAGDSEGNYIGFGYHEYKDCIKWLYYIIDNFNKNAKIILHGVSMGSATVMMMSGSPDLPSNVKFTVADCGYTSAYCEFEHNLKSLGKLKYPILFGANMFNKVINGYDFKEADALTAVKNTRVPILFIHGNKDDFVPTRMGYELYEACTADFKDLLIVEGAEHAQAYKVDGDACSAKIDEFVEKFIN